MNDSEAFSVRVQFTFSACRGRCVNRSMQVDAKVAELFYTKKNNGTLKQWLLRLAYEAAEKEIDFEVIQSQSQRGEISKESLNPENDKHSESLAERKKQAPKPKEIGALSEKGVDQSRTGVSSGEVMDGEVDDESDDDLVDYMPLVLSEDKEKKKGRPMPGSFRNLVLDSV